MYTCIYEDDHSINSQFIHKRLSLFLTWYISSYCLFSHTHTHIDLLGTPGYLAPELLKRSVESNAPGYNREIDL